ncbi:protein of unknown function (plasmid) [Cupriavidus taiwanensis]|uniref:Uncharacterized protein n=1 Tax=Cupriavidus taiwanensis TaxID=164546 RepID=A0A375IS17_9BURK|nr:protein of unknown function [Cupriavidus taiwanensis]
MSDAAYTCGQAPGGLVQSLHGMDAEWPTSELETQVTMLCVLANLWIVLQNLCIATA